MTNDVSLSFNIFARTGWENVCLAPAEPMSEDSTQMDETDRRLSFHQVPRLCRPLLFLSSQCTSCLFGLVGFSM